MQAGSPRWWIWETAADTVSYDFTRALRDEMTDYTRYDNSISYGNGLTYRLDYTDIQVGAAPPGTSGRWGPSAARI